MGGMIRQFVDASTASGSVAIAGSGADFDDIVGVRTPDAPPPVALAPRPAALAPERPVAVAPVPIRRRSGHRSALVAMAALGISGISIAGALVAAADLMTHPAVSAAHAVLASESGAETTLPAAPTTAFGSSAALGDGLAVSISDPIAYSPSAGASAGAGVDVVSTVTVTNTGGGTVDPRIALTPLGTDATRVFDRAQGIRANSIGSLAGGETLTYRVVYAVGDVAKLSVKVVGADGDTLVYGP